MHPEELIEVLKSLSVAADLVECIDDPSLQSERGWDLANWSYQLVPWGVRFLHHNPRGSVSSAVVAVTRPGRQGILSAVRAAPGCPTHFLLLA